MFTVNSVEIFIQNVFFLAFCQSQSSVFVDKKEFGKFFHNKSNFIIMRVITDVLTKRSCEPVLFSA